MISDDQFYPYWKPKTKNLAEEDLQDARLNAETGMGWEALGALLVNWQGCACHLIELARIMVGRREIHPCRTAVFNERWRTGSARRLRRLPVSKSYTLERKASLGAKHLPKPLYNPFTYGPLTVQEYLDPTFQRADKGQRARIGSIDMEQAAEFVSTRGRVSR